MAKRHDLAQALMNLRPGAEWTLRDCEDPKTLVWHDEKQAAPHVDEVHAELKRVQARNSVPRVTKRQFLLWLHEKGYTEDDVHSALEKLPNGKKLLIEWKHPDGPFKRHTELFDRLAEAFDVTHELDDGFVRASKL